MANKPDKFGMKFWLAVDVHSKYLLNGIPYFGKDETRPVNQTIAEAVVTRRLEPIRITKGVTSLLTMILSTMHQSMGIAANEKKTPETIQFYNETKFCVDVFDQMTKKYSVKASSRRWPVQVLYNVLDMAAINAWVLFKECTGSRMSRRKFILQVA